MSMLNTGMGGSGLDPLTIPNLTAWWDAEMSPITKDGSNNVSQWNDLTTNGYHLTATLTAMPLWVSAARNGKNVIRFNGSSNTMVNASVPFNAIAAFTLVIAFLTSESGAKQLICGQNNKNLVQLNAANALTSRVDTANTAAGTWTTGTAGVFSLVYDGSQGSNATRLKQYVNGAAQSPSYVGTIPATVAALDGLTIGSSYGGLGSWVGVDLYSVFFFSRAITDIERAPLESWIRSRFAI